ncbi:MAG: murein biosynthesis integral membrane protein MurJ [Candidatus Omnitrophica bacterium]|nr:murein biosynthesis integral membrane protein MurJ [Candidatus Omnitrophota bacterium]
MSIDTSHRLIIRSAGIIGFATLLSRFLGFIRDVTIARLFGTQIYAQAFVVAFRIPNLFRDFFAEGAANSAFVPVFSEYNKRHSRQEFWELTNTILNLLLIILVLLVLLGIFFSPQLVRIIAPGFMAKPEKLAATVFLNRIIFPYLLLVSLAAYAMAILNTLGHFSVPAFASCFLNISIILCAYMFGEGITGLATGILVGGLLQLAVQIPVLYKKGFRLRLFRRIRDPVVATIGRLMAPRILSTSIYQLNNFVDSIFGSLGWIVGEAGVAVLYFSYRLIQFPLGIFSTALSQAVLPTFSLQSLTEGRVELKRTLCWAIRVTIFIMIPVSVVFMVLANPLVSAVFGGGRFDVSSARLTASALFCYSIGLFAYGSTKILQSCFFSLRDTVTPVKVSGIALAINVVLNTAFMFPLKISGIALATSISGIISFIILFRLLEKKIGDFGSKQISLSFLKILLAAASMGGTCFFLYQEVIKRLSWHWLVGLAITVAIALLSYAGFCFIFRVKEMEELRLWILQRR